MVIKNGENCKKCIWDLVNECNDYPHCSGCPNFSGCCNCTKIKEGYVCPYFIPTGSHISHITTPEEFKHEIEEIIETECGDEETSHVRMDELMCRVLTELGYGEGIILFENRPKCYT